ncbi:hypothetical protein CFP59_02777 [Streptomyces malaysiensis subsp. malaysiensis]|uniref:DUF3995 domain-containing protein n=2 Tax=Streptomyces malaysiensis TaxID=92644 RepID=UPI000CA182C0|nr:DUF3995 domain-containing protein [Streptomyces sp. M56]AUA10678.1 hypothetical protein CFP59_02777 [Streptomyces sp. M56]
MTGSGTAAGAGPAPEPRRAALAAFGWAVVFTAMHVYWFAGGRFGLGDAPDVVPEATSTGDRIQGAVIVGMFAVGIVLPLALTRPWGRRIPRRAALFCLWTGAALVAVRGGAGLLDTALRSTCLAPHGLTGLTYEQITGDAHPSAYTIWSGVCVDAYFMLGGVLYGLTALRLGRRARPRRPVTAD